MKNAIVYGNNIYSQYLCKFIENGYNKVAKEFEKEQIHIIAYWNVNHSESVSEDNLVSLDNSSTKDLIDCSKADILLIASQNYVGQ